MNILHHVTQRLLRKNPTRTWVTIIGITLSMALFVAVLEGAYSGLMFMLNIEGNTDGYYQGYYYGLDEAAAEAARKQSAVKTSASWQLVGYAALDQVDPDAQPLIAQYERPLMVVDALGENEDGNLSIRLVAGRMPENDTELILPSDWFSEAELTRAEIMENAEAAVGSTVTFALGQRAADNGETLTEADSYRYADGMNGGEHVENAVERTYTVVGVYRDFDRYIEQSRDWYRALTVGHGTGEYRVFFTLRLPFLYRQIMAKQTVSKNYITHSSLLRYYGVTDNALLIALYGVASVLVGLVALGSISLIYNSFSISVSERTRQFGILKSVGATKKQIRAMVRYEAFLLAGVGIVLGMLLGLVGIGVTLWGISPSISRMMTSESVETNVRMQLVVSPLMLVLSAVVCLITTLISARIPADRAVRLSPIDAIRQSADVRIAPREVKTSRLTQKLFGFEGMMASKSFRRSRKSYRATVLSLFISIVLFISASSMTAYMRDSVNQVLGNTTSADVIVLYSATDGEDLDALLDRLLLADSVTGGNFSLAWSESQTVRTKDLTSEYIALSGIEPGAETDTNLMTIAFVDDDAFGAIAGESGFDPKAFYSDEPVGLIVNESTRSFRIDGKTKYQTVSLFDQKAFPVKITARIERERDWGEVLVLQPDGILPNIALSELGVGENEIGLYPMEELNRLNQPDKNGNSILGNALFAYDQTGTFDVSIFDPDLLEIVPASELYTERELTVIGACKADRLSLPGSQAVLYPYSRMTELVGEEIAKRFRSIVTFAFCSSDHAKTTEALHAIAEENRLRAFNVQDLAESFEMERLLVTIINVFAYGFIILISLIAAANVFNTISTSIILRRREFAMLKSIGLGERGFRRMLNYECIIYGLKGLLWGLPAAALVTYLIYTIMSDAVEQSFYIPWHSVVIAVGSVFAVVFATMLYASSKIRKDNPIDALKNENL